MRKLESDLFLMDLDLYPSPDDPVQELAGIAASIVSRLPQTRKIICWGARPVEQRPTVPAGSPGPPAWRYAYALLLIADAQERRPDYEVADIAESVTAAGRLLVLVQRANVLSQILNKGSVFFGTVCRRGLVIFNSFEPAEEPSGSDTASPEEGLERQVRLRSAAREFYEGAVFYLSRKAFRLSAFMLHQAVESVCSAILVKVYGHRPSTHNLSRLLKLIGFFTFCFDDIFPIEESCRETELFSLLQRGYSDARYREDYRIGPQETAILLERVERLLERYEHWNTGGELGMTRYV
jgi:uncharacterized protein